MPKGTQFTKEGKIGGARSFNGSDDRIEIAGQLPDAERFTISVWIKTPGNLGKGGIFCDYNGTFANVLLFYLAGNQAVYIRADKTGKKLTSDWHHLVWVSGQRDSTIYIDQEPIESGKTWNRPCRIAWTRASPTSDVGESGGRAHVRGDRPGMDAEDFDALSGECLAQGARIASSNPTPTRPPRDDASTAARHSKGSVCARK